MMRVASAITVLMLCLALASACGGADAMASGPIGGSNDGGGGIDNPPRRDAEPDADNEVGSGDKVLCRYDDEDVYDLESSAQRPGLSTATDERGFALLHHGGDGALLIDAMEVGGNVKPSVRLVAAADAPGRALIAASSADFAMLWMNGDALALRLLASGASTHVLSDAVLGTAGAELFTLIGTDEGYWAAYVESDGGDRVVRIQAIGTDGELRGAAATVALPDDAAPGHLELARVDGGFLVVFSEPDPDAEDAVRVLGIALDDQLEPRGGGDSAEPVVLSKKPAHELPIALDARGGSAGVIYQALEGGVRPALKVQRIEPDGTTLLDTWNVVSAPRRAQDGSIASFGQGYAVAYRALSSLGNETPSIRVAFIDQSGLVVHDAELLETTEAGGPTSVSSTADGKLLVSWTHQSGGSRTTRAIQLDCPGALVLCGGQVQ